VLRASGKNSTQGKIFDAKLDPVLTRGGNENLTVRGTCSRAGLNWKTIRLSLIDARTEDTGSGAWTEDRAGKSFDTGLAQGNQVQKMNLREETKGLRKTKNPLARVENRQRKKIYRRSNCRPRVLAASRNRCRKSRAEGTKTEDLQLKRSIERNRCPVPRSSTTGQKVEQHQTKMQNITFN
jgi:hypothetical protein